MRRLVAFVSLTLTIFVAACSGNESTAPSTQNDPVVAPKGVVPPSFATASNGEGLSITTDKDDYMPGDTVWFTGAGWQPGDTLDIVLTDDPQTHEPHTWWVPVNETGGFRDSTYIVDTGDLGVMFTLVATSRANPQQTLTVQFTDGRDIQSVTLNNAAATTVAPGGLINANVKGQLTGNSNNTLGSIGVKAHVDGTAASTAVQLTCFNVNPDMGPSVPPNQIPYDQSFSFNAPNPATQPTTYDVIVTSYADNACTTTQGAASFSVNDGIVVQVANQPANQPTGLAQFKANGTTSIATGGATNETSVVLKGTVSDPNAANTVKLQVEVKPVGTVFTNTASAESGLVTNGTVASATVAGLSNNTNYHWQARAVDNNGLASDWVSFGDNPEADTDFRVDLTRPSVAINQAATQVDPTGASPIKFTAVFNEDVTGFATGDVTLTGGSAPGTLVGAVSGGPKEYEIAVTGMTGDGTVIASIAEGVATDLAGNTNLASTSTDNSVLYDKTPPVISSLLLTPSLTNGSGSVEVTATATDATTTVKSAEYNIDGGAFSAMSADDGTFDEATEDVKGTISAATVAGLSEGTHSVCVRATDVVNNTSPDDASCATLIIDRTPPAISDFVVSPNPVAVNTPFTISAKFTDALSNVTGAQYSINGGTWTNLTNVGGSYDTKIESGSASTALVTPDVAEICVRSSDAAGNTNTATSTNPIQCVFLAVYDPTAGFVTGGGWIMSPLGAYAADLSLTGKATFGFVSKYLKGANVPTGNTEFQFHAGNLNFSSSSYEWLVVQGSGAMKATYKGTGTVNGQGGYGFLLAAIDGAPDKFRIKIWQIGGSVIYDNQVSGGAGDNADPTTALGSGSIMIHVPKK